MNFILFSLIAGLFVKIKKPDSTDSLCLVHIVPIETFMPRVKFPQPDMSWITGVTLHLD